VTVERFESCVRQSEFAPQRLLETEFCSPWWLTASHVRRRDRQGRIVVCRKAGCYPIGGMVRCPECGRSAPPDISRAVCVDCRVEIEQRRFNERLRPLCRDDRVVLLAIYWRRPTRTQEWLSEGMPAPRAEVDDLTSLDDQDQDAGSAIDEADLFDGSLEPDQRWGNTPSSRDLLDQLRKRFLDPHGPQNPEQRQRIKRSGAGCRMILLPENDEALKKEIAYFQARGVVIPSARRVSNPRNRRERPVPMSGM
jgi:hypothetical protein